ncbi:MAG: hypothetical protein AAGJ54_12260 [Planctomycetota bacterium]
MLWLSSGLLVLTLVMVVLGVRGKRVDDHPVCRKCRFDLDGLDGPSTCPECGRALSAKLVAAGNRRRRTGVLGLAVLPLVAALVLKGFWVSSQQGQWNKYKPTALLLMETRVGDVSTASGAFDELLNRVVIGNEDAAVLAPGLERAAAQRLQVLCEPGPDDELWIKMLVDAMSHDFDVAPEVTAELSRNMLLDPRPRLRSKYVAANPLELSAWEPGHRPFGAGESVGMQVWPDAVYLDGERLPFDVEGIRPYSNVKGRRGSGVSTRAWLLAESPPLGEHTLRITGRIGVTYNAFLLGPRPGSSMAYLSHDPTAEWEIDFTHRFEVVETYAEALELVTSDNGDAFLGVQPGWADGMAWAGAGPSASADLQWFVKETEPRKDGLVDVLIYGSLNRVSEGEEIDTAPGIAARLAAVFDGARIEFEDEETGGPIRFRFEPHRGGKISIPSSPPRGWLRGVPPDLDALEVVLVPDLEHAMGLSVEGPVWNETIGPFRVPLAPPEPDQDTPAPSTRP